MLHLKSYNLFEQLKPPVKSIQSDETRVKKPQNPKLIPQKSIISYGLEFEKVSKKLDRIYKVVSVYDKKGGYNPVDQKVDLEFYSVLDVELTKSIKYYEEWLKKPDTIKKLKNKGSIDSIRSILLTIKILASTGVIAGEKGSQAFVTDNEFNHIFWCYLEELGKSSSNDISSTLIHEIGHLIDFKLRRLGEKSIYDKDHKCKGVVRSKPNQTNNRDDLWNNVEYIETPTEIYARLQQLRKYIGLNPIETPQSFIDKFLKALKDKKLYFNFETAPFHTKKQDDPSYVGDAIPHQFLTVIDNKTKLCFTPNSNPDKNLFSNQDTSWFIDRLPKYTPQTPINKLKTYIDMNKHFVSMLLINFAEVKGGKLIIDIQRLCNVNNELVKNKDSDSVASKTA